MSKQSSFSLQELRIKHPVFRYNDYSWELTGERLVIAFDFKIEPDIVFKPEITIISSRIQEAGEINPAVLDNLIFNLGLVEMISYWKSVCSPVIEIKPGGLSGNQIAWWKDLMINGLGEFFFVNKIDFRAPDFLTIKADREFSENFESFDASEKEKDILVLTSGGKDTALTLSILQDAKKDFGSILLNPTGAALELASLCGASENIIIERRIAPKLLELNKEGYLNGHTPFSAYLGFLSVAVAVLFGYKNVIVSNERSSNEGNTTFLGKEINHQYTKTLEFERKFQNYVKNYLTSRVGYFSFLRPLYEIQIAAMLTKFKPVLGAFKSCNRNYRENSWCGNCPKCLAVYILIYPFLKDRPIESIFGKDPFENKENIKIVMDLIGFGDHKPFECVGTHEETAIGLFLGLEKARERYTELPAVWKYIAGQNVLDKFENLSEKADEILSEWDSQNALPEEFDNLLRHYYQDILLSSYATV